ncbi:MAG: hypothetical protein ACOC57_07060 [Acidobacteriota bacterium]
MWIFNYIIGKFFDILFFPFRNLDPWFGMIFISLLTGVFMLFVFGKTSNQEGIRKIKNLIKAHLLELRLFKDNFALTMKSLGNILRCNLKYIGFSAKPMLIMIIPLVLIIIQMNFRFGYQSLAPGDTALLKVKLKDNINPLNVNIALNPSPGIKIETPSLRIEEESEINWRIRISREEADSIKLEISNENIKKLMTVSSAPLEKVSPLKVKPKFIPSLLYPTEPPIDKNSEIESVEITYPPGEMKFLGLAVHWLIIFFILSIAFGFALKGFLGVEI